MVTLRENGRRPQGYWNKDTVKMELRNRLNQGKSLKYCDIYVEDRGLQNAIHRNYESWQDAVEDAGIDQTETQSFYKKKPRGYWTKEQVLTDLNKLKQKGTSNLVKELRRNENGGLYGAIYKYFGKLSVALEIVEDK